MPKFIKFEDGKAAWADDAFVWAPDEEPIPAQGGVILSLQRFQAEGEGLLAAGRPVGVRIKSDEQVEALADILPQLALVALEFPKFRDGRAYSSAVLLRERYGYTGQVRAVGEVLREQFNYMIRCGFDAFEPSEGAGPEDFDRAAHLFRHVYQAAADDRAPAFIERAHGQT
ncbi:MAG: DUF934 domain-containing protein [Caulobacteraceae bacterium]